MGHSLSTGALKWAYLGLYMSYKSSSIGHRRPQAMVMVWYGKVVLSYRPSMEHSPRVEQTAVLCQLEPQNGPI